MSDAADKSAGFGMLEVLAALMIVSAAAVALLSFHSRGLHILNRALSKQTLIAERTGWEIHELHDLSCRELRREPRTIECTDPHDTDRTIVIVAD